MLLPRVIRRLAPLPFFVVLMAHAASAQPRLHVDEFVEQVLVANPGLEAMAAAVEVAEHRIASAGALDDPRASFGIAPRTLDARPRSQWSLSQTLPWPGKRELRREAAGFDAEARRAEKQALRLELAAAARVVHAEWTYVHAALAINEEHEVLLAELIEQTRSRMRAPTAGYSSTLPDATWAAT